MKKNILPEFKLSYKKKGSFNEMFPVNRSEDAADICRRCFNQHTIDWKEEAIIIALNRAHKVLGWYPMSSGGINGTVLDPRVVFQIALSCNASYLIISHNHPSGNIQPSQRDKEITREIVKGGEILQIQVLDHIIITSEGFFSFSDEGLI